MTLVNGHMAMRDFGALIDVPLTNVYTLAKTHRLPYAKMPFGKAKGITRDTALKLVGLIGEFRDWRPDHTQRMCAKVTSAFAVEPRTLDPHDAVHSQGSPPAGGRMKRPARTP